MRAVRADFPLVIATNRDEFYARASSGPVQLLTEPRTVGGRDLMAGGTWMGVTEAGLFVGLTNHRSLEQRPNPALCSRGELVLHALSLGTTAAVSRYVQTLDGREYNSFNLMWGDARELKVGYGRVEQSEVAIAEVPRGVHVLPNARLDSPDFVKVRRAKQLLADSAESDEATLIATLAQVLSDRVLPALEDVPEPPVSSRLDRAMLRELSALCVRTPSYGTRSSTIVLLEPGRVGQFLYADGPPDQTAFTDVKSLF
ncbi:MAG: hypothetical protein JWN04_5735 [Myxococcaceae bacterium]|nr:hypothetical protein [Myxococcaceae bacterium]